MYFSVVNVVSFVDMWRCFVGMVLVIGMFGYSCIKVVLKLFDYLVDVFGEGVDVVWFDCGEYCDL